MAKVSFPPSGGVVPVDVALTLAVFVETFVYGVYTWLFLCALFVLLKRTSTARSTGAAWVILTTIIMMYAVATIHLAFMLYRFIRAYITVVDPRGGLYYFFNPLRWDNILNSIILCIMSWLGDFLAIFRCYYVWNCNFWVILIPATLLIATIGTNSYVLFWFTHPHDTHLNFNSLATIINSMYPVAFVQNSITTGLISLRIWRQHRASTAAGVVDRGERLSLMGVLRIVIESAMIYTLQIFLVIILYYQNDTVQFVLQAAIVPSIGVVFVLIAVRVHVAQTRTSIGIGIDTAPMRFNYSEAAVELGTHVATMSSISGNATASIDPNSDLSCK